MNINRYISNVSLLKECDLVQCDQVDQLDAVVTYGNITRLITFTNWHLLLGLEWFYYWFSN
jgi:hypothetical protein